MRGLLSFLSVAVMAVPGFSEYKVTGGDDGPACSAEVEPLGRSVMECIYSHKIYDPKKDESRESFYILEIGRDASRYSNYRQYKVDSVIVGVYNNKPMTFNEYRKISNSVGGSMRGSLDDIVKRLGDGSMLVHDKVFIDYYVYADSINDLHWTLLPETAEVCGYECHCATADFRGRSWKAWYSMDIPQDNGPWKFGNLPGLILKVEDADSEHVFEAIAVRNSDREFGYDLRSFFKTSREKFNKMLQEYKDYPGDFMSGMPAAPMKADGSYDKPVRSLFYNAIEKE